MIAAALLIVLPICLSIADGKWDRPSIWWLLYLVAGPIMFPILIDEYAFGAPFVDGWWAIILFGAQLLVECTLSIWTFNEANRHRGNLVYAIIASIHILTALGAAFLMRTWPLDFH